MFATHSVGCAPRAQTAAPISARGPETPPEPVAETRRLLAEVTAVRGLREKTPIPIERLTERDFTQAFHARVERDLGVPGVDEKKLDASSYVGFYDDLEKRLVVRKAWPRSAPGREEMARDLLIHEIVHALQDQHFATGGFRALLDTDRRTAVQALVEGDALLVRVILAARARHAPWKRAAFTADEHTLLSAEDLALAGVGSTASLSSEAKRKEAFFPYDFGLRFASALYRAGGFALLDRAHAHPPESTQQILHPERYLAADHPSNVAPFAKLPGYVTVGDRRMGELQVALTILGCFGSMGESLDAASGWDGGRAATFRREGIRDAVAFAVAWETEERAVRAEAELRRCFVHPRADEPSLTNAVERRGRVVATFLAFPPAGVPELARAIVPPPPAPSGPPPFGSVAVPPAPIPVALLPQNQGRFGGGAYESPWLGLRADMPAPLVGGIAPSFPFVRVHTAEPKGGFGSFAARSELATPGERASFLDSVGRQLEGDGWVQVAHSALATPLGEGTSTTWRTISDETERFTRITLVPACGGVATYAWFEAWRDDETRHALETWRASFRATGPSPGCAAMRRENEQDLP